MSHELNGLCESNRICGGMYRGRHITSAEKMKNLTSLLVLILHQLAKEETKVMLEKNHQNNHTEVVTTTED